jgi:hypothetical protein
MRLTKLRLNGLAVVDLPIIGATPQDVYILKGVDGLGPPEIEVRIGDTLNAGGVYQGRRAQNRQIVALIGLNPDYSAGQVPADLRTSLYGMLSPSADDAITVQIVDDEDVVASTTGYVSKIEINPFSDKPEVQMTIDCDKQYFEAPGQLFLSPDSKPSPVIDNVGTAPTGLHMELQFTADVTNWTITHISGRKMEINYAFLTGDLLEIDTRPGQRGIWVTRVGVRTNIIWALSSDSIWHMLHGGANNFATSSSSFDWGDVYYLPQFWGI